MAVRRVGGWCEIGTSLVVSWNNELVVGQSPAGKNVSMEAEDPSPGNNWWRHSRLKRLSMCCSELQCVN
jgi:hypothetical protein